MARIPGIRRIQTHSTTENVAKFLGADWKAAWIEKTMRAGERFQGIRIP